MNPHLPNILIVDDDPDDRFLLTRLLGKAKTENPLVALQDGTCAQKLLRAAECNAELLPCLIFTDFKMPCVDGLALTRWIRTHPQFTAIPVVMISGSGQQRDRAAAEAAGVTQYLEKFPTPSYLRKLISELCPSSRCRHTHA